MFDSTENRATTIGRVLAFLLAALMAMLLLVAPPAEAKKKSKGGEKIVFASNLTKGKGVDNPEGDSEIFVMDPKNKKVKQLTKNALDDGEPTFSPDGEKIAYTSYGDQTSNPEGDTDIYLMNADGSGPSNLSNNGVYDLYPVFSSDSQKIAYQSSGAQTSNPEGDYEVYVMNAPDGSGNKNLSNNGGGIDDDFPAFSPDGQKVAYESDGAQTSNPEGEDEVYLMNALDGSGKKNLTNNGGSIDDNSPVFSPNGQKVAYTSYGKQSSNLEGDAEVYVVNADGSGPSNLSNNGDGIDDSSPAFSPDGQKLAYQSSGAQTSNPEGDLEIYLMNNDGSGPSNLSNNGLAVYDFYPVFSSDGQKVAYMSYGKQSSNPEGEFEVYVMNALDGSGTKNLTKNGAADFYPEWGGQAK